MCFFRAATLGLNHQKFPLSLLILAIQSVDIVPTFVLMCSWIVYMMRGRLMATHMFTNDTPPYSSRWPYRGGINITSYNHIPIILIITSL